MTGDDRWCCDLEGVTEGHIEANLDRTLRLVCTVSKSHTAQETPDSGGTNQNRCKMGSNVGECSAKQRHNIKPGSQSHASRRSNVVVDTDLAEAVGPEPMEPLSQRQSGTRALNPTR